MASSVEKILRRKPQKFRAAPAHGVKSAGAVVDPTGGDQGAGIIRGAAVITRGEALGHRQWVDAEMLRQTADGINASKAGSKARFTHPGESSDGMGSYLGRWKAARIDGDVVRADLHFSKTAHETPDGDLAAYVMGLAIEDPEAFGVSIVYEPDYGAEDKHTADHEDEDGDFQSPDPDNQKNYPHARIYRLRAADVVDEPAANPDGLFRRGHEIAAEADALLSYSLGLTDTAPNLVSLDIDPDRAGQFVQRFLDAHNLQIIAKGTPMADDTKPAEEAPAVPVEPEAAPTPTPAPAPEPQPAETPAAPEAPAAPVAQQKAGKDFIDAFGTDGAVWFAEGRTFDEAKDLYIAKLRADNERLSGLLKDAPKGEQPVNFQSAEGHAKDGKLSQKAQNVGPAVARVAASIKLPGRN